MNIVDLRDMVTEKEIRAFETRVDDYAAEEFGVRSVSGNYLLRFWNDAKSEYLAKLFGGKDLILSKEITFKKDGTQLYQEMVNMCNDDPFIGYEMNPLISKYWRDYISASNEEKTTKACGIYEGLCALTRAQSLIDNAYPDATFMMETPEGKEIKVPTGCKVMRAIGKIVTAFGLNTERFEQFRIKVSQILNQKNLTGKLSISIHPLDYVTMSDNDSDWKSCMSWEDRGCYRQGTVEMMNSPMVVVGYLESSSPMRLSGDMTWNNKKWRELFVVNRDMITNIKSYPYHNPNLSLAVIDWLKELADKNLKEDGFNFHSERIGYEPYAHTQINDTNTVYVKPESDAMYNDFANDPYGNWMYLAEEYYGEDRNEVENIYFNYSGTSECMGCGEPTDFIDYEGHLMGDCCDSYYRCEMCDEPYQDEDYLTEVDGRMLCPDCISDYCREDSITGELHITNNMVELHLIKGNKEFGESIYVYRYEELLNAKYFNNIRCFEALNRYRSNYIFVRVEDCTKEGLELFGITDADDVNETLFFELPEEYKLENIINRRLANDLYDFRYTDLSVRSSSYNYESKIEIGECLMPVRQEERDKTLEMDAKIFSEAVQYGFA